MDAHEIERREIAEGRLADEVTRVVDQHAEGLVTEEDVFAFVLDALVQYGPVGFARVADRIAQGLRLDSRIPHD